MSRRHSRFTTANLDRELTVDEFLRGLARTPRTPRNRHRPVVGGVHALKGSKSLIAALPKQHGGYRKNPNFLPETLERDGADRKNSEKLNKRKGVQRVDSDDIEWNALVGGGVPKRRRKRYVAYNSLPLSRDTQNEWFQFSNNKAEIWPQPRGLRSDPADTRALEDRREHDMSTTKPDVHGVRLLHPVSVIRRIVSPGLGKEPSPGKLPRKEANSARVLSGSGGLVRRRVGPRNKPGSGFDWASESLLTGSEPDSGNTNHVSGGLSEVALPVTEVLCDQLSLDEPVDPLVKTLSGRPQSGYVTSGPPVKKHKTNDYPGKPLTGKFKTSYSAIRPELPGITQIRSMDNGAGLVCFSGELGSGFLAQELCDDVGKSWDPRVMGASQITDTGRLIGNNETNLSSYSASRMSDMNQETLPLETVVFSQDWGCSKQNGNLADGVSKTFGKANSRVVEISAQKGVETVSKQKHSRISAFAKIGDIEIGKNLFAPPKAWKAQAELVLKVLSPPSLVGSTDGCVGPIPVPDRFTETSLESGVSIGLERRGVLIGEGDDDDDDDNDDDEEEEEEEEESTPPVSRRLFVSNPPKRSYFSTAQWVLSRNLNNNMGSDSLGYLRYPTLATHLPTVDEVIDEEEQVTYEDEGLVIRDIIPTDTYNMDCTKLPTPKNTPAASVQLKDLLDRTGARRRPSISGIFRGGKKPFIDAKLGRQELQGSGNLVLGHKTDIGVILVPGSTLPITSKPLGGYARRRASFKVLRPYVSPLGKLPLVLQGSKKAENPTRKLGCRMARIGRVETQPPAQRRFKPPLLSNRAKTLLGSSSLGVVGEVQSCANMLEDRRELYPVMEKRGIDIQKVSSFRAVHEAW